MKGAKRKERRRRKAVLRVNESRHCACCLKPFMLERGVRCTDCGAWICKNNCSRLQPQLNKCWCCIFCYHQRAQLIKNLHWFDIHSPRNYKSLWNLDTSISMCADKSTVDGTYMARTALRKVVDHAVDDVCKLANSENIASNRNHDDPQDGHQEFTLSGENYNDLIKDIVNNKIIEKSRINQPNTDSNNSNMKKIEVASEIISHDQIYNTSLEITSQEKWDRGCNEAANTFIEDQTTESVSVMIENSIEEITDFISDEEVSDNENCPSYRRSHRVPFPELGLDIIDPCQISMKEFEDEMNDPTSAKIVSLADSWKDNWYFRKKNFKQQSKCVSMFVPNSNIEYRAMIGDKDVDETSDLSEFSIISDEEFITELPINDDSFEFSNSDSNKTSLINRHNDLNYTEKMFESTLAKEREFLTVSGISRKRNFDSDNLSPTLDIHSTTETLKEEIETNNLQENIPITSKMIIPENNNFLEEKSNTILTDKSISIDLASKAKDNTVYCDQDIKIDDQRNNDCTDQATVNTVQYVLDNTDRHYCNTEKEIDQIDNSLEYKITNGNFQNQEIVETEEVNNYCQSIENKNTDTEIQLNAPPKPGSIAEREHKKWENATSLKNNPYSKENIQKRLLEKNYVGFFNLSRYPTDLRIDNSVASNGETNNLVESVEFTKDVKDISCHNLNSYNSNIEIEDKTDIIESNSAMDEDSKFVETNSEKNYNKSYCFIAPNANTSDVIQTTDVPSLSKSKTNNKILDNERKNIKSEIHAKLNNQEQLINDTNEKIYNKKSLCIDVQTPTICQIDLKASVYEKDELPKTVSNFKSTKQQVVNNLDINPVNYSENSITRAQSTNKLEDKIQKQSEYKSNLMKKQHSASMDSLKKIHTNSDFLLETQIKSNGIIDKDISNVTVFNSTPCTSIVYVNDEKIVDNNLTNFKNGGKYHGTVTVEQIVQNQDFEGIKNSEKSDGKNKDLFNDTKINNDKKEYFSANKEVNCTSKYVLRKSPMLSVKKLVQVFDKKHQENIACNLTVQVKPNELENKGMKSQQITANKLPKHLHSLTARSLSKEFRDGLRQNKANINNSKSKIILSNDGEKY